MGLYNSKLYMEDIETAAKADIAWDKFSNKSIAISGGTGMIGSYLVDVILFRNEVFGQGIDVFVLGRSRSKAQKRFDKYMENEKFHFIECDINDKSMLENRVPAHVDFIIHAASNTHPKAYSTDPIGTITANVIGTNNLLEWGRCAVCDRFLFLSSVEIYGENKGDVEKFSEDYLGYIDCNTLRAGYPESKRLGEALCQAYINKYDMDIVIPRLSRVYGPTMLETDTKALSQFIRKGAAKEDIVLKSEGTQKYSYSYVADAVLAILHLLLNGSCGEAYNVVSKDSDITLKDLAQMIADYAGTKVCFALPDEVERAGYSTATKAMLDHTKLVLSGWSSGYDMQKGLECTIAILGGLNG